jgi:hypothetical protein
MKPHSLTESQWYTVKSGRFKGQTGKAFSPGQECHALWFPQTDEKISFLGCFEHLRLATDREKLHVLDLTRWH